MHRTRALLHASNPAYPDPDWTFNYSGGMQVNLDATYAGLTPQAGGEPQWAVFVSKGTVALFQITAAAESGMKAYSLAAKTSQLTLALGMVLLDVAALAAILELIAASETYASALSAGSPPAAVTAAQVRYSGAVDRYVTLASNPLAPDQLLSRIVEQTRDTTVFVRSELLPPADPPYQAPWALDAAYSRVPGMLKPVESGSLQIAGGSQLPPGQPVAISGKRVRLQVQNGALATLVPDGATGALAVADLQTFLLDAFPPSDNAWRVATPGGAAATLTTAASNITLMPAAKDDPVVGEAAIIGSSQVAGPITTLSFTQALSRIYDRATVTVNANVVLATQGETMHEILGNGDATNPALQFTLKQSPVTYTSSQSALGSASTLEIWVNNLQWHEVPNFLGSGPSDRVFVTRTDDQQKLTAQFGDGVRGARVPTGQMNVRAVYRKGSEIRRQRPRRTIVSSARSASRTEERGQPQRSASGGTDPDTAATGAYQCPAIRPYPRTRRFPGGLHQLRPGFRRPRQSTCHLDLVRHHARHLPHRCRRGRNHVPVQRRHPRQPHQGPRRRNAGLPFVPLTVQSIRTSPCSSNLPPPSGLTLSITTPPKCRAAYGRPSPPPSRSISAISAKASRRAK